MGILRRALDALTLDRAPSQAFAAAAEVAVSSPRFAGVTADPGVLYGTQTAPTIDDFIFNTVSISRAEALAVPALKRARDMICAGIGQFPLVLIGPDGKQQDWSLLSQPEAGVAPSVTWTRVIEDLLLYERAWLKVTHVGWHGKPAEVIKLDPATITVQPSYVYFPEGSAKVWPEIPGVIRIDSPNGGLLTASTAIRMYIFLQRVALRAAAGMPPADWFTPADGADPVGIPVGDETQDEADNRAVREILDNWYMSRQLGETAFIPAALDYHRDGFNPEQLQLSASREFAVTEIARLTGIDAEELSVSTTSRTYFNGQDRRRTRLEDVLGPYMTAVEGRLSMEDVTPRGYQSGFDTANYLRLDDQAAATTDATLIGAKVLTPDEAREKRGLEPLGLDTQTDPAALPAAQEASNA